MNEVVLTGLDGANPLGFMAALGVLEALSEARSLATLRWDYVGAWRPIVRAHELTMNGLIEILDDDRRSCSSDPALALEYDGTRDLKPPPGIFRAFARNILDQSAPERRRSIDWIAAFATDVAVDNKGNTKPTALHFTAGQQSWLGMVSRLAVEIQPPDFAEALFGPWTYRRELPVMGWDSTQNRDYALRATNPSNDKKAGIPGADWLAVRGLANFPTAPRGTRIATTGCRGEWKTGTFSWSLWNCPLERDLVRTLLRLPGLSGLSETDRDARGVVAIFTSDIRRSEQGGYGSMSPPTVV